MERSLKPGESCPLGATVTDEGVNFSIFSKSAKTMQLLIFDQVDAARPARVIKLDPGRNRTYHYWHVFVPGLGPGRIYGYRAGGPLDPKRGLRFDPDKVLLDPYGRAVAVPRKYSRVAAEWRGDNAARAMKSVVTDPSAYDWEGDRPLRRPFAKTMIYEMHVRGFTIHPSSGVIPGKRGTFAGLIEKLPYLQDLGITAVELLPVFQYDPWDCPPGLVNYWGYCPVSFFAPHHGYSSRREPLAVVTEFRDMVKACHRAGIEVLLDVVYNHTAEGNEGGPTICFKGLQNDMYYILERDGAYYADYTGTGNTLNANQPIVRRLIVDSLRYWVREMHVDGFRFDLASILSRDQQGRPLENPPVLWDIESDPALAGTKLIAEAWDAAGLYQVGRFVGDSWKEWNGQFRDDVRSFLRGDNGYASRMASRLLGSPDLYGGQQREPEQSINFITCHDGFTLNDLVSYRRKHNEANGEGNRDGTDDNRGWNCGAEGPSSDPAVETLRNRQVKNFLTVLLMSLGAPMLLMGDEVRRSQQGNNNAYCQDNEVSWFDWRLLDRHADIHRFTKRLIALYSGRSLPEECEIACLDEVLRRSEIQWHGVRLHCPDWSDVSHTLACTARTPDGKFLMHAMVNAYTEALEFELPPVTWCAEGCWRRLIDTALAAPDDISEWTRAPLVSPATYRVRPHSIVVLLARAQIR
ncbi:MAG: glycogen debranching enzyme GlgX [Syntrophobacteraceae bacterium CG2_30_61_12]|nr:MAG: glycogen debranching enzyme GlgX [Syntrophobacteraceae bacterium CG2_30_61_12]